MNGVIHRTIFACLLAAVCFAASPRPDAAQGTPVIARFVATAVSMSGVVRGRIDILIERWSTDQEWEDFRGALAKSDPAKLFPVLHGDQREAGVVLMPGIMGLGTRARQRRPSAFQLAREIDTPAGRRVVVATDQNFGFGERVVDPTALPPEVTLLDIRFGPDGNGIGKLAPAAKFDYNKETKIFELANYGAQPVRLTDVRSEKPSH